MKIRKTDHGWGFTVPQNRDATRDIVGWAWDGYLVQTGIGTFVLAYDHVTALDLAARFAAVSR